MNKFKLLTLLFFSNISFAESLFFSGNVSTSCSFGNYNQGVIEAKSRNGTYSVGADGWIGTPANVAINYSGSPSFSVNSINGFLSSPQNLPITTFETGVAFSNSINNQNAIQSGANWFSSGDKSLYLSDTVNTDIVYVSFVATANSPFPMGNYEARAILSCQ